MIPIKDTIRARTFPAVNWLLILANTLVFFYELNLTGLQADRFILTYALIPGRIDWQQPLSLLPYITHMFLHGGWLHFLSNVWILFIFGDNVEDRLGSARYLIFYILGGLTAATIQVLFMPNSQLPLLGASGAIAAAMGAYFSFYPRARVLTVIPIFIFPWLIEVPAMLFLGFWFLTQLFSGIFAVSDAAAAGGIAWWAHIGGFLFGALLAYPFCAGRATPCTYRDEYYPW